MYSEAIFWSNSSLVKLNEGFTCIAKVKYFRIYFQFVLILIFCLNDLHKTHFSNDCLYACLKHIVFQFGFSGKSDQYVVRTVSPCYSGVNKTKITWQLYFILFYFYISTKMPTFSEVPKKKFIQKFSFCFKA